MGHFDTLLLEEQAEAVQILSRPADHLLAFGTGLGKTYAALASFEALRRKNPAEKFHLLVVCTKSATVSWLADIGKHTNYRYFLCRPDWSLLDYAPLIPSDEDITIVTYNQLDDAKIYLEKLFSGRKVVMVLDEMHKIKKRQVYHENNKDRGLTWYGICKVLKQNTLVTWGLTATPLLNKIEDLFTVVDFLFPHSLGTKTDFMKAYTIRRMRKMGLRTFFEITGYRNLNILHEAIKPYVLTRYREFDVRFDIQQVELTHEENIIYLRAAMGSLGGTLKMFAARLPDLQNAVDTFELGDDTSKYSSKETKCVEMVRRKVDNNQAVIVYSSLRASLDRLKAIFKKEFPDTDIYVITGSTLLSKREQIVNDFKAGSILLMTGAGGESLNLQVSNSVIFFNLTFNIGEFVQIVGRIVRITTEHDFMEVSMIESKDTIDSYKRLMLEHNSDKIKKIVSQNPNLPELPTETTKDYIIKMRKDLLWKKKELRKLSKEERDQILGTPPVYSVTNPQSIF